MNFTYYYKGLKDPNKKTRFDVVVSTGSYGLFERQLINKREPNAGGLSFYVVDRPGHWGTRWQRQTDKALTKAKWNISSIIVPDPNILIGYGDVKNTQDALIFIMNKDWTEMEIFIACGQKNNKLNLFQLIADGELIDEMNSLRKKAQPGCNQNCYKTC